ncbi:MAG: Gfo/Idh/MocA family oxidoreductase [Roseobacter sp.]
MNGGWRVACVGAGYFSQFHLEAWSRHQNVQIVGLCDRDYNKAALSGWPAFLDAGDMIETVGPDVLDIIVPPQAQADVIRLALMRGVQVIVCQKPFCRSLEEAETIVEEAEQAGAMLIVHENFRFMPWYRFLKVQIAKGSIGKVHQVTFRLRPGDGQGPDAYLDRQPDFQKMPRFLVQETAVHWIDTFRFLFGNPISVYADLRQMNPNITGEDAGLIVFEHGNGVRALFDGNRHLDHASDNLRRTMGEAVFEGTTGTLSLFGDGRVERRSFGAQTSGVVLQPDPWDGFGGDCVFALQSHVIDAVSQGRVPENIAREYCEVLRVRDAIYRSAQEGRRIYL